MSSSLNVDNLKTFISDYMTSYKADVKNSVNHIHIVEKALNEFCEHIQRTNDANEWLEEMNNNRYL